MTLFENVIALVAAVCVLFLYYVLYYGCFPSEPSEFIPLCNKRSEIGKSFEEKVGNSGTGKSGKLEKERLPKVKPLYVWTECEFGRIVREPGFSGNFSGVGQTHKADNDLVEFGNQKSSSVFANGVIDTEGKETEVNAPFAVIVANNKGHIADPCGAPDLYGCDKGNAEEGKCDAANCVFAEEEKNWIQDSQTENNGKNAPDRRFEERNCSYKWVPESVLSWVSGRNKAAFGALAGEMVVSITFSVFVWLSAVAFHSASFFSQETLFFVSAMVAQPISAVLGFLYLPAVKVIVKNAPAWRIEKITKGQWNYYWTSDGKAGTPWPGFFARPEILLYQIGRMFTLYLPVIFSVVFWTRGFSKLGVFQSQPSFIIIMLFFGCVLWNIKDILWKKKNSFWFNLLVPRNSIVFAKKGALLVE